ncbi:hypothetical protein F5Y13DRAFT_68316 [Hypoxylon sp. FL1857]|nr:hypothetical protein F5Y13DRAFT_68316 [Hypoxylon sp. FL1857]
MDSLIVHHGANLKGPESVSANVHESTTIGGRWDLKQFPMPLSSEQIPELSSCLRGLEPMPARRDAVFVFSIRRKLPFYVHCPLCGSLTMASLSRVKSPANQRTEKSTFVYEYAINTNPRPCGTHYPILWEKTRKESRPASKRQIRGTSNGRSSSS